MTSVSCFSYCDKIIYHVAKATRRVTMKLNCVAFAGAIAISFAFWVFTVDGQASERREELWLEASRVPAVAAEAPGHGNGMHLCSIHAYLRKSATGGAKLRAGPGTH